MGLTLLTQASMPVKYWWEAFSTSTFLINHLSTPTLHHKSPIEVLLHVKPKIQFLKVFGCTCFPHLRDYNNHKLDFRSTKCIFIGYSPNHKGYKCLHPSGQVYIANNITFNETILIICLAGGETPEWFSHRGEGSALSFHLPSVSVLDGNKLQALLFWVVLAFTIEATQKTSSLPFFGISCATLKNKSDGIELFDMKAFITLDRNSTKHSWIKRVPLIGLEESLQGVEELELNVEVRLYDGRKYWGKLHTISIGKHQQLLSMFSILAVTT